MQSGYNPRSVCKHKEIDDHSGTCVRSFVIHKNLWQAFEMVTDEVSHQGKLIKELGNMQKKLWGDSLAPCDGREENQSSLGALHNSGQKCSYSQGRWEVLTL